MGSNSACWSARATLGSRPLIGSSSDSPAGATRSPSLARCDRFMRRSASSRCWSTSTTDCGNHLQKKRHEPQPGRTAEPGVSGSCRLDVTDRRACRVRMEEAARRERYRSLFSVARRRGASAVATRITAGTKRRRCCCICCAGSGCTGRRRWRCAHLCQSRTPTFLRHCPRRTW